jgi:hypothetical protein
MSRWTKEEWLQLYMVAHGATRGQAQNAYIGRKATATNPEADPRLVNPAGYDADKAGTETGLTRLPYMLPEWVPQTVKDNPVLWIGGAAAAALYWWSS